MGGYWESAWPTGGGAGEHAAVGDGLGIGPTDHLVSSIRPLTEHASTCVHRDRNELYVLLLPTDGSAAARVERVDPVSLQPMRRSGELAVGGEATGGTLAVHGNGDLYLTAGTGLHRLGPDCTTVASTDRAEMAAPAGADPAPPSSSLVVLDDGTVVAASNAGGVAVVTAYDPDLRPLDSFTGPEPLCGPVAASGPDLYLCGSSHLFRLRWTGDRFQLDLDWQPTHSGHDAHRADQGPAVGPIVANGRAWLSDNRSDVDLTTDGDPAAAITDGPTWSRPIRASGVAVDDPSDVVVVTPTDVTGGWVTSAPFAYDRTVLAWDTGNTGLAAFDVPERPQDLPAMNWYQPFRPSVPPLFFPSTGELVINDFRLLPDGDTSDDLVVLDLGTGYMKSRVPIGTQRIGTGRIAPGWDRDVYYCTQGALARVRVESL
jgi:hypothetical protein